MKVSAINTVSNVNRVNFQGESSKNSNRAKSVAGATVIALAAMAPAEEANAQYYVPVPPPVHYYVPAPVMNVPKCFIVGDESSENYEKTLPDVFKEIDREIEENGQISVNEVVRLEEANWNGSNYYPMTRNQKVKTAELVKSLSRRYNEYGSNPNTINYNEYKKIMTDYMQSKNIADFVNLLQILMGPRCQPYHHPHPHPPITHPPYHHHYRR